MKRSLSLIVFSFVFILIGIKGIDDFTMLSSIIYPISIIGNVLRSMSLHGGVLNVISYMIYLLFILIPIVFLIYKIRLNDIQDYESVFLLVLSILIGITLYNFINPHLLYNALNTTVRDNTPIEDINDLEIILKSGVAYLLYLVLAIYFITKTYYSKKFDSIMIIRILIYVIMISISFSVLAISLSNSIFIIETSMIIQEKIIEIISFIFILIISSLMIYLLELFRRFMIDFQKDSFQDEVLTSLNKIHNLSYILLMFILGSQLIKNLFQFLVLDKLLNIHFTLDIPVFLLLLTSFIFLLSKYVTKATKIKAENELII